jgi:hypothetical protein
MSLKLFLSTKSSPWDTVYQTETGEPVYRAERTEYNYSMATCRLGIYRISGGKEASNLDSNASMHPFFITACPWADVFHLKGATAFGLKHTELASLRLRYAHPDELTIHGMMKKEDEVFKKPFGINWYGRYVWKRHCDLSPEQITLR